MAFFKRTGSVICPSCGSLVGVHDQVCWTCGRRSPGMWGFASPLRKLQADLGFGSIVIFGCTALYIAMLLFDLRGVRMGGILDALSPSGMSLFKFGASGAGPIFLYGRWWTLLSAGWLHAGFLHILFNMLWVRQLAPATAELYGTSRIIIIYTISSIVGFTFSSFYSLILGGAGLTVGASAPIFGLLAALVVYGRRGGSSHIGNQAIMYAVILFLFGLTMPNIDNAAHAGGFIGGYIAAYALNHLHAERTSHLITALICLALTALSILASLLTNSLRIIH
jgi:rhomboid protease GluP